MKTARARYDLGLIIPTNPEFEYMGESVPFYPVLDEEGGFWYELELPGRRLAIVRVLFTVGVTAAGVNASQLLYKFNPQVLAIVGIGGALGSQLRLGDVVVGSFVQEYLKDAMATADADGRTSFVPSGDGWPLDERMLRFANHFKNFNRNLYDEWARIAKLRGVDLPFATTPGARREAEYSVQSIASGDLVVNDPAFKAWLLSHDRKRAVIEMEAAGAARAVKEHDKNVTLLVLRGISDFADGRKLDLDAVVSGETKGAWRRYAARNAIELLLAFLASPMFPWSTPASASTDREPRDTRAGTAGLSKDSSRWAWDLFVRGLPVLAGVGMGVEIGRIDRLHHPHAPTSVHDPGIGDHPAYVVPNVHDPHIDDPPPSVGSPY